ncbi:MAG: KH domain-containing protein [Patescibacteria group bacterium]|nr:KH domain-containing protein [Patescibacteria group bacterium]
MKENEVKKAKEIVNNILSGLSVSAKANVFAIEEYLKIEIEGKDSSLLIGYHGDNLRALRHLLSSIIRKQISEDIVVMVDVGGYVAGKERRIQKMAQKAIDEAKKKGKADLPPMTSFERRIAHSYIADQGLTSESEGEGQERHIVVKK